MVAGLRLADGHEVAGDGGSRTDRAHGRSSRPWNVAATGTDVARASGMLIHSR